MENLTHFLEHLCSETAPFVLLKNGQPPSGSDTAFHNSIYWENPEFYALLALVDNVTSAQRMQMLFQLLQPTRVGMSASVRQTIERVTDVLMITLPPDSILKVFLALRRVRANHKHTTRAILKYILNHPQLEDMALRRRPAVVDVLEHALGKNSARGAIKQISTTESLPKNLLRQTRQIAQVKAVLPHLYGEPIGQGKLWAVGDVQYSQVYQSLEVKCESPKTVTATNRGEISAILVHLYRGGYSEELQKSLSLLVQSASATLPFFPGKVALVLDASASTKSYGEREFCLISQSVAFQLVLEKCCQELQLYSVGGSGELPIPEGDTDLANALLDALANAPDLVVIVSDGYENQIPGDLAKVVATLPQLGIETPVVFCHSKFTKKDDLSLRRPALNLPQLEFWHQDEFASVMVSLFSRVPVKGQQCLREFLLQKLARLEKELMLWTAKN
ncbi:MAG: VWA domain-containing protein [Phormidium sp.]